MRKEIFNQSKKTNPFYLFLNNLMDINSRKFVLALLFLVSLNSFSQTNIRVFERNDYLSSIKNSSVRNYNTVLDLMDGVQSSIYLTNEGVRVIGQIPVCMYSDVSSLSLAGNPDMRISNIEMVTIKIDKPSELTSIIDLSIVSRYKNVKYIYFRIGFDFKLPQLIQLIKNCDPKCIVIYSVEKGA